MACGSLAGLVVPSEGLSAVVAWSAHRWVLRRGGRVACVGDASSVGSRDSNGLCMSFFGLAANRIVEFIVKAYSRPNWERICGL
jgi:hypothetical protein